MNDSLFTAHHVTLQCTVVESSNHGIWRKAQSDLECFRLIPSIKSESGILLGMVSLSERKKEYNIYKRDIFVEF